MWWLCKVRSRFGRLVNSLCPPRRAAKIGRPPRLRQRTPEHPPVAVKPLAMKLPASAFKEITWREGTARKLQSRFAAVRVRPAHRDYEKAEPHPRRMVIDRMAAGRSRTYQVLAIDAAVPHEI